jgi:hypothetical protein
VQRKGNSYDHKQNHNITVVNKTFENMTDGKDGSLEETETKFEIKLASE